MTWTCPLSRSVNAGGTARYGTCTMSTPAIILNSSPATGAPLPLPSDAKLRGSSFGEGGLHNVIDLCSSLTIDFSQDTHLHFLCRAFIMSVYLLGDPQKVFHCLVRSQSRCLFHQRLLYDRVQQPKCQT